MDYMFKDLVQEAKAGIQEAQEEFLGKLKPLLHSAVKRYGWGLDSEELLQEAKLAVLDGIQKYDETRGVPFLQFIKTMVSFHVYNTSRKQRVMYSLNTSANDEDGQDFIDLLEDKNADPEGKVVAKEVTYAIQAAIDKLDYRERFVVINHFYRGVSLKAIAALLGVSYKTALRIKDRALKAMAQYINPS